ncbi:MAG: GAF domain-containing protein [Anaerolineales bacterium]|nr:GAF domain-containing protein [Anaerolineales bacterium]
MPKNPLPEEFQLGTEILPALSRMAQAVAGATQLQPALEAIVEELAHLFRARSTAISLLNSSHTATTVMVRHQPSDYGHYNIVGQTFSIPPSSIFDQLLNEGQSVIVSNAQNYPLPQPAHKALVTQNIHTLLLIPLKTRAQVIGNIGISTDDPQRTFSSVEIQLGEIIAGQIAGTIELFRSLEQERRQRQVADSLREVATILNSSLDLPILLSKIFEQLARVIEHNGGGIFLRDGDDLVLIHGLGAAAESHVGERISLSSQNPTVRAFNSRQLLMINDGANEPYWLQWPEGDRLQSWIGVPLLVGQQAIGILTIDNFTAAAYNQDDAQVMQIFAEQAALAIHNARLFESVRQSEERYRVISEVISKIAYVLRVDDQGGFYRDWATEGSATQLTGFTFQEIDAQGGWPAIVYNEDLPQLLRHNERLKAGQPSSVEYRIITKDGRQRWLKDMARPVWDDKHQRVISIYGGCQDISDSRRLEAHLLQSQKMEAVGQLAAGIAHHFNNMFTTMTGYLALAIDELPSEHTVISDLERVQHTTQRAAALTQQLLTFSRNNHEQRTVSMNLNELIIETRGLLEQLLDPSIDLKIRLASDLWWVNLDASQFKQVLINLVLNARDAMPRGGTLELHTAPMSLTVDAAQRLGQLRPGDYVRLIIADNGIGMSPTVQERIFEPFFTTKEVGQGTGLGLYAALGVIQHHSGHIEVDSAPGQGATVTIYLPRSPTQPHPLMSGLTGVK